MNTIKVIFYKKSPKFATQIKYRETDTKKPVFSNQQQVTKT